MCLGVPGQVRALDDRDPLAKVEVAGVTRTVNIALVRDEGIEVGDWVLIHLGFAMSVIDEEEAAATLSALSLIGEQFQSQVSGSEIPPSGVGDPA